MVLTPTDVFAHGVGEGEILVGATLEISPLQLVGADPMGSFRFADGTFEFRNSEGVIAAGLLTDIHIDADSFAFSAALSFENLPSALPTRLC